MRLQQEDFGASQEMKDWFAAFATPNTTLKDLPLNLQQELKDIVKEVTDYARKEGRIRRAS